ncbi:MAG: hypothetical protein D6734_11370 [Candidatus Schekmanbacteria bacterium]|nr:MAG: hypothetical protein D6734_11370 [Candidatus Schekmanbacteria bacterium]
MKKLFGRGKLILKKRFFLSICLLVSILIESFSFAGTITVNTTQTGKGRDSKITLREAIELSEGQLSYSDLTAEEQILISGTVGKGISDTINFNIDGDGPHIIQPISVLPTIYDDGTVINGYSQPGASKNTATSRTDDSTAVIKIELDGSNLEGFSGISLLSSNNVICGLSIHSFGDHGIFISGTSATGNHIWGNYIGVDSTGLVDKGNKNDGVIIINGASNNIIGTDGDGVDDIAERNVISGNGKFGVDIFGVGCDSNKISGNFLGVDVTGKKALGNDDSGINVINGPKNNIIGTDGDGVSDEIEGNVVSGNKRGLYIRGSDTSANIIAGNYIGVDVTGILAVGNSHVGIFATSGTNKNIIGYKSGMSSVESARNIISGNGFYGIILADEDTDENLISGNYIGTSATGDSAVGNNYGGIGLINGPANNVIGDEADENLANVVSGNNGDGITIEGGNTKNNAVAGNIVGMDSSKTGSLGNSGNGIAVKGGASSNSIESNIVKNNEGTGIKVVSGGNTLSENIVISNGGEEIEVSDSPNNPLPPTNPPEIVNAVVDESGTLHIKGTSGAEESIEIFAYPDGDESSIEYIGTADANKKGKWTFNAETNFSVGDYILATATGNNGTSSYSSAFKISSPGLSVSLKAPFSAGAGDEISLKITYANSKSESFSNVFISLPLPISTTFVSASDFGVLEENVITWEIGTVSANGSGELSFKVKISDSLSEGDKITFSKYSIVSSKSGTAYGNDVSILISSVSNLVSSYISVKDVNGKKIKAGDIIRYSVFLINKGNSAINGLILSTFLAEVFQSYELVSYPDGLSDDSVLEGSKYFLTFSGINVNGGETAKVVIDMKLKSSVKEKKSIRTGFSLSTDEISNFYDLEAPKLKVGKKIPSGSIKIEPSKKAKVNLGGKKKFKAFIKKLKLKRVVWEIVSGNGSIDTNNGIYKAPMRGKTPQKVKIRAYSVYNPSINKSVLLKINPVRVEMSGKKKIKLKPGNKVKLKAKVKNASKKKIIWEVNNIEGGNSEIGTISSKGVYTMPESPSFSSVTVRAVSFADKTKYAEKKIKVK